MPNRIDDSHIASQQTTTASGGVIRNKSERSQKRQSGGSTRRADLPMYYRDWVIFQNERQQVSVVDCESYHLGELDAPVYSTNSVEKCLTFIDGGRGGIISALRARGYRVGSRYLRLLMPFLRLYVRFRRERLVPDNQPIDLSAVPDEDAIEMRDIEYAGWIKPFMDARVGTHPVFNFVSQPPAGFRFVESKDCKLSRREAFRRKVSIAVTCMRYTVRFMRRGVSFEFIINFWATRGFTLGHLKVAPGKQTIALYPTYLFFIPNHSWVVEIEDMLTIMAPFVNNGNKNLGLDRNHPYIKVLEVLMEGDECKGIISHLKATADGLQTIFKHNPVVSAKIRHIQLGMPLPPRVPATRKEKPTVNILFINGWAQDKRAAYRRGILDALKAFSLISKEFENVTMTVRSSLPKLDPEYQEILADKKIIVIEEKLPIRELRNLYETSDILLFPAVRMAVTTLIQAMANSLAIVASDGFGIEEYVKDGVNGLIARGFRGSTGTIDQDGFFREDYMLSLKSNAEIVENCAQHLRRLISDKALRVSLQANAREYAERHFSVERWNQDLEPILRDYAGLPVADLSQLPMTEQPISDMQRILLTESPGKPSGSSA